MVWVPVFAVLGTAALAFGTAALRLRLSRQGLRALFLAGALQSGAVVCDSLLTFLDGRTELIGAGVLGGLLLGLGCFFLVVAAVELAQAQRPAATVPDDRPQAPHAPDAPQ
jgi:hypothetical protein